jgi:hypothetical protein
VGGVSTGEALLIGLAAAGVACWALAGEPLVATACVVAADLIGVGLMVPKTYNAPESETLATFALASLAGALAAVAVAAPDPALLLYPIYFCIANGCPRRADRSPPTRPPHASTAALAECATVG